MDRATRYGSCVPVTTIGIAPIRTRDQRATNPPTHLQMQPVTLSGASLKADVPQITGLRASGCSFGALLTRWTGSDVRPVPSEQWIGACTVPARRCFFRR